jgi:hypothetical protein
MKESFKKKIKEIAGNIKCTKDFKCYKSNFNDLCEMKDLGMDSFLLCLDKKSKDCAFMVFFGGAYLCRCPLRICIAKELKK